MVTALRNQVRTSKRIQYLIWATILLFAIVILLKTSKYHNNNYCLVSFGKYSGSIYTTNNTLDNKCLIESPWMRVAQHTVQLSEENDNVKTKKVIDDWLFIDYHDRINVLVEAPSDNDNLENDEEQKFIILEQTKYALDTPSYAIVGGIIEPKEDATLAAKREVQEELNISCNNWNSLGKYRTDVNRGMGYVHPYLATDCTYITSNINNEKNEQEQVIGGHDTEQQQIKIMKLSDVKKAVLDNKFVEVQWSNTVALAMLHISLHS